MKDLMFKLHAESNAIRDQLLSHGRFEGTSIERDKFERDGKSD